jgi:hypothetical protein
MAERPQAVPMTEIDIADDEKLRFIQRVLESDAPESDRRAALQMVYDLRTRVRKAYAAGGVPAADPRCPACNKPRLQPGMCWRCRNPGVLPDDAPGVEGAAVRRGLPENAPNSVNAAGVPTVPPGEARGIHALADVVSNLLQTGRYVDEEGEETQALVALLQTLTHGVLEPGQQTFSPQSPTDPREPG